MRSKFGAVLLGVGLVIATPVGAWADHERGRCYDGDYCGDQEYDQWNSDQNNHNRRNRGAFSPGPFDDSPVDAFNNVCMPGATCTYNPPPEQGEQPR